MSSMQLYAIESSFTRELSAENKSPNDMLYIFRRHSPGLREEEGVEEF